PRARSASRSLHDALPISPARAFCFRHQPDRFPSLRRSSTPHLRAAPLLLRVSADSFFKGQRMRFEGTADYVADKDLMVAVNAARSEEHTSELQSRENLVC